MTRRRKLVLVLVLSLVAAGSLLALHRHSGLAAAVWHQGRDAGLRESWNNFRLVAYLARFFAALRYNPESGYYDFEAARGRAQTPQDRGLMAYHTGDFAAAVDALERAVEQRGESEELLFWLANAYLRQAEAENCLAVLRSRRQATTAASPDAQSMCSLPLRRHYRRPASVRRAAELFDRLLDRRPRDPVYRWLLNFTAMTQGSFPAGVPAEHRIDTPFVDAFYGRRAERLAVEHADLVFEDRAAELHVDTFDAGKGVAVEDFDGDGDLDLVTGGNFDPLRYYENLAGRDFADRSLAAGFGDVTQVHIITAADYDGDGWLDLFVGRPFLHFLLLRNRGDATFADVTAASGLLAGWLEDEVSFTWASAWGDVDDDGDLDLFIARWGMKIPFLGGPLSQPTRGSRLFVNKGGQFADRTAAFGLGAIVRDAVFIGVAWGDADNDGDLDLFLSSLAQRGSLLLRNLGGERFEVAERHGPGFMAAFVDVDHDGQLEIFQGGFTDAWTSASGAVFGEALGDRAGRSVLLRRRADGRFHPDAGFFDGGGLPIATMGTSYGDLDLDGCLDFYFGTGTPEGWYVLPNLMFRGRRHGKACGGGAVNVSMLNGFGNVQKGHGIVFFDFDDDGDQDVYSSLGGMWPADRWTNQLFVNHSARSHRWVKIRLRGRHTNRFGLGARITVRARDAGGAAILRTYTMDHKTGFGSPPYLAHIGLLDAETVDEIEVFWPVSGRRCSYPGRLDEMHWLDETRCSAR